MMIMRNLKLSFLPIRLSGFLASSLRLEEIGRDDLWGSFIIPRSTYLWLSSWPLLQYYLRKFTNWIQTNAAEPAKTQKAQ
jgi:hypothetical protein